MSNFTKAEVLFAIESVIRIGLPSNDLIKASSGGGTKSILESISNLEKVYNVRPDSYLLQIFFDAKSDEIVSVFSRKV